MLFSFSTSNLPCLVFSFFLFVFCLSVCPPFFFGTAEPIWLKFCTHMLGRSRMITVKFLVNRSILSGVKKILNESENLRERKSVHRLLSITTQISLTIGRIDMCNAALDRSHSQGNGEYNLMEM
jgi:hypothetical protein